MADDEEAWLVVRGGSLPRRRPWGEGRFEAQTMRRQQTESTPGREGSECKGPGVGGPNLLSEGKKASMGEHE